MPALIQSDSITGPARYLMPASSASSWDARAAVDVVSISANRAHFGTKALAVAFILGVVPSVTPTTVWQSGSSSLSYTAQLFEERRKWTWRSARRLALAILHRAEADRRALAAADAAFYADDNDSAL